MTTGAAGSVRQSRRRACCLEAVGLLLAATLAGCVTTPASVPPGGRSSPSAAGEGGGSPPGVAAVRRGGYYLDDGPGERGPKELEALAALPEPVPVAEPLHPRANRPYRVMGSDYLPMTRREQFLQRGVASWYGRKFHGRLTSVGEPYDMYRMTAAHPTLPIPSFARVNNLENGRSVVVRVNDRGPFLHGRVIDLSYLAAHKLGYLDSGSAMVEVELLDPSRPAASTEMQRPAVSDAGPAVAVPAAAADDAAAGDAAAGDAAVGDAAVGVAAAGVAAAGVVAVGGDAVEGAAAGVAAALPEASARPHYLQLGAFSARSTAEAESARLRRQLDWLQVPILVEPSGSLFRVRTGPYLLREQAAQAGAQVAARVGLRPLVLLQPPLQQAGQ